MSRSAIAGRRKISDTRAKLERTLMRQPAPDEMATAMDLTPSAYHDLLTMSVSRDGGSIDELYSDHDLWFADMSAGADTILEHEQLQQHLATALAKLPEREATILQMFFIDECNLEEIGKILGVGSARVCQIKKAALGKLREHIGLAIN